MKCFIPPADPVISFNSESVGIEAEVGLTLDPVCKLPESSTQVHVFDGSSIVSEIQQIYVRAPPLALLHFIRHGAVYRKTQKNYEKLPFHKKKQMTMNFPFILISL